MALYSQVKQTAVGMGQGNDELMHTRKKLNDRTIRGRKGQLTNKSD